MTKYGDSEMFFVTNDKEGVEKELNSLESSIH